MGRKRRAFGRDISGVLLLDKPAGLTSNAILQDVKKLYFAKKAGHTGSLDPLATGMLPICFGEATKFSHYLLNADKKYTVTCQLGVRTDSGDADGNVIETRDASAVRQEQIETEMTRFLGTVLQVPPMHSAIKVDGEPLYKKAHRGETVERESREITVFAFELLSFSGDQVQLSVHCSKGTYVRTLVEDLGEALGCGAHVTALRRTAIGAFGEAEMVDFEALQKFHQLDDQFATLNQQLLPVGDMVRAFPKLIADRDEKYYLQQGQAIRMADAPQNGMVGLFFGTDFLGVGEVLEDGRVEPRRLVKTR